MAFWARKADEQNRFLGCIVHRDFLCRSDRYSPLRRDSAVGPEISIRGSLESLSSTPLVAHALPGVACARVSIPGDCHGVCQHWLLSPPQVGLAPCCRHFCCERAWGCDTASFRALLRGGYRSSSCGCDPLLSVSARNSLAIWLSNSRLL